VAHPCRPHLPPTAIWRNKANVGEKPREVGRGSRQGCGPDRAAGLRTPHPLHPPPTPPPDRARRTTPRAELCDAPDCPVDSGTDPDRRKAPVSACRGQGEPYPWGTRQTRRHGRFSDHVSGLSRRPTTDRPPSLTGFDCSQNLGGGYTRCSLLRFFLGDGDRLDGTIPTIGPRIPRGGVGGSRLINRLPDLSDKVSVRHRCRRHAQGTLWTPPV